MRTGAPSLPPIPPGLAASDPADLITALNDRFRRITGLISKTAASTSGSTGSSSGAATPVTGLRSPLDFGAVGNGVADDTAAVAAAITATGYLWLPPDKIFVTSQVTVTAYEFCCFGGGELLLKAGSGTDLLVLDGSQYTGGTYPGNGLYAHINGVRLHGNASNQPVNNGACLVLRNAAYTAVQDCLIYAGSGDGIRLENYQENYNADEVNIINNRIFSCGRHGIYLLPTLDPVSTTIAANVAVGTRTVTPASMTNISVGTTLVIQNADTSHLEWVVVTAVTATTFTATFATTKTGPGITVTTVWGRPADHVIIGNHINYNGMSGIRGTRLTSTLIANNNVLTNSTGIYLDAADRCVILGNAVRNNKGSGVIIDQDQSGNGFGRAQQVLIDGNQLHYNNVQTPAGDELDVFNTDGCVITGNYLGDTDFTPVALYGIQLSDSTGVVISGNVFGPTIHGPLLSSGFSSLVRSFTDLVIASANSITSVGYAFVAGDIGKQIRITSGTGFVPQFVVITGAAAGIATVGATLWSAVGASAGHGAEYATGSGIGPYRTMGNVNLADGMQGTLANLPSPPANDYGLTYYVTDYEHVLLWIGTQWVFQLGDSGTGWIVNAAAAGGGGGLLTAGKWHACDGTAATILNGDGTTQNVTTPNLGNYYYMRI